MEPRKTRLGILGAGTMAATHAVAYAAMADVEVVGVSARDVGKAAAVAGACNATPAADACALIADAGLDAIDICLPSAIHPQFVIAALERGKHVFCETPMALTLDEATAMRDAARKAGRLLQVGLLMRSIGAYRHLKAAVAAGTHGRLLSLSTWRLGSYLRPGAPDHKAHYGDPTTELMTFDFDVANWLMGRPARLAASGNGEISALLSYADGCSATVVASGLMPAGAPFRVGFRALFEQAVLELETVFEEGPPRNTFTIASGGSASRPVPLPPLNPYEVELRHFIDCVRGEADPALLDAEHAIAALVLSLATQRALATGKQVDLGA
ncbi:Gfo/Idh/MocA family oxidoreductase [Reyranella sp.]|jgi:predicted dehydrogenase|uniref:Gfo/Idh/MocA family protein n=1 Tax=Reyranella sp. TaxID=1929291 RepID=UPI002F9257DD